MRFFGLKLQRLYLQLLLLNSCGLTESAEDEEQLAAEEEAFSIPGWKAPKTWPEVGITKQKFRQDYGDVWDSVSEALGAPRRAEIKRLRTQELHDHVNARHYKLGLEGTSKPQVVNGPSHDWTSVDKRSWAMEDSYAAMHNQPHQIKEPGHQGQRIFTAHSDSKYGSEKATYRHELDRQKLIRKLTYVRESELQMELISLPARLSELEEIVANSYRCEEYPSGEDSQEHASELSCGSADYSALQQEITSTKKRIVELQRGTDDSDSLVKFSSDHIFNEIDTDGNGLASMAEVTDWGARAATRGKLPSVARVGSLRKAALVSPDGHLIFDPKPGSGCSCIPKSCRQCSRCHACVRHAGVWLCVLLSYQHALVCAACADAVRAACAGTVRDGCADCVKSRHSDKVGQNVSPPSHLCQQCR
jgi:hypothetical protein